MAMTAEQPMPPETPHETPAATTAPSPATLRAVIAGEAPNAVAAPTAPPPTPAAPAAPAAPTEPGERFCAHCQTMLPLREFPRKRGGYAATCKAKMREYSAEHYAAHRTEHIARVRDHKQGAIAARMRQVQALARQQVCASCGCTYDVAALGMKTRDRLALVGQTADGATLGMLASRQSPEQRFLAALGSPAVAWRCRPCLGAKAARTRRYQSPMADAVVGACLPGDGPKQLLAKVRIDHPDYSMTALNVLLGTLVRRGRLERVARGKYRPVPPG